MAGNNSVESQAKHDVQDLKKSGDHTQALQHIADQAHTMSSKDLKTEQQYWNTIGKAGHDHLPGLTIHRNNDGNVDSVKDSDGKDLYDRSAEVKKTLDNSSATLKNGQGPFQAFKDAGLSDAEASKQAKAVTEATGRHSFKAGEKLGVHSDGSVTTGKTDSTGNNTEEKYNPDKTHETKVTKPNGDFDTTFKDKNGNTTGSLEHRVDPETKKVTDTTKNAQDKVTQTSELDQRGRTVTDLNPDTGKPTQVTTSDRGSTTTTKFDEKTGKTSEKTTENQNGTTTTKFGEDGATPTEKTITKDGVTTSTKFQGDGVTPTEKTITKDGQTSTRKYAPNGIDTTELTEKGKDNLTTTTEFDPATKKPTSKHQETADGYADTTYNKNNGEATTYTHKIVKRADGYTDSTSINGKLDTITEHTNTADGFKETTTRDGKLDSEVERKNGPNGSYIETRHLELGIGSNVDQLNTIEHGEVGADGKFKLKRTETTNPSSKTGAHSTIYDINMVDEKNGVGTKQKIGSSTADQNPHPINWVDGHPQSL